jgi:glycosyltransferase involved in cell wall biosynthesis
MNLPLPISVAIIALNEEKKIANCLSSLQGWVSQIVVLDSGSTDQTEIITKSYQAEFHHQPWLGFAAQKNRCNELCNQPWILSLDCDEIISDELKYEIIHFFSSSTYLNFQSASVPRKVFFMGQWISHGDWYPDRKIRLFQQNKASWEGTNQGQLHEELKVQGPIYTFKKDLHHYSFDSFQHYYQKQFQYIQIDSKQAHDQCKKSTAPLVLLRAFWRFFRAYIIKLGFLDGFLGFWIAICTAFFTFIKHTERLKFNHSNSQK